MCLSGFAQAIVPQCVGLYLSKIPNVPVKCLWIAGSISVCSPRFGRLIQNQ